MSIRSNLNFVNTVLEIILNISRLPSNHTSTLPVCQTTSGPVFAVW
jgi:hypothetical protein